jgi:DNA repair protein RecO (recombination protein O)
MDRNYVTRAVVISTRDSGESNKTAVLLSESEGLVYATVYGGAKSKIRSLAVPFHSGTAWIYRDGSRARLSDFDPERCFPSLRESLRKGSVAQVMAEIALRGQAGGGEHAALFGLLDSCLTALDSMAESETSYVLFQYVWRYLELAGLRPDPASCFRCGRALGPAGAFHRSGEPALHCPECQDERRLSGGPQGLAIPPQALRFLALSSIIDLPEALAERLEAESGRALKPLLLDLVQSACEGGLRSLAALEGII